MFSSLTVGKRYDLSVRATSLNGLGRASAVATYVLLRPEVPRPPRYLFVGPVDYDHGVQLRWTPPDYDGQAPLLDYVVSYRPASTPSAPWTVLRVRPDAEQTVVPGLTGGIEYAFRLAARNAVGSSSPAVGTATPHVWSSPSAPYGLTAQGYAGGAVLRWHAPDSDGGLPITGYEVTIYRGTTDEVVRGFGLTPSTVLDVTDLTAGVPCTFTVTANNTQWDPQSGVSRGGGLSPVSARSPLFVPGQVAPVVTVPGAPRIGVASGSLVSGKVRAVARWLPPVSDGGSAVLAHRVYAYRLTASGAVLSTTVSPRLMASYRAWTMLLPVGRYRFAVRAANALGYSTYSARSNLVAPARVPTAPRIGVATSGVPGGAVTATARWLPPVSNGGTVITAYRVYAFRVTSTGVVVSYTYSPLLRATTRAYTMTLPRYGWYRFAVRAVNAMGYSPFSAKSLRIIGR